jgi:hypothetical protein
MQNFPYELIRQAYKSYAWRSYVCEKWLQFHMKHAEINESFLKSHAKLYKAMNFRSYVLNFNSYAPVKTKVKSGIFFSRNRKCMKMYMRLYKGYAF